MTNFGSRFVWLAVQAFDGVLWAWYITVPILLLFVLTIAWLVRGKRSLSPATRLLFVALVGSCLGILFMATGWYWDIEKGYHPEQTEFPQNVLSGFVIVSWVSCILCVAFARGQRLAAAALALPGIWYSFWCFFVAAMAISGDWL